MPDRMLQFVTLPQHPPDKRGVAERRADFHALGDQRYAQFLETGESVPWEDARAWLKQRLAGKHVKRPASRKQAR